MGFIRPLPCAKYHDFYLKGLKGNTPTCFWTCIAFTVTLISGNDVILSSQGGEGAQEGHFLWSYTKYALDEFTKNS